LSTFDEIADISVETIGNSSTLVADVPWAKQLLPLPALSGGTTRAAAIMLAMAHRTGGVVLVDEIESGIYHRRQANFAKGLIKMAQEYRSQLIMTTHSNEWLDHFIEAARCYDDKDIAFWRMERLGDNSPSIRRFSLSEFADGMAAGEMR
jgi:AAA15 family ATPase/GTPase